MKEPAHCRGRAEMFYVPNAAGYLCLRHRACVNTSSTSGPDSALVVIQILNEFPGIKLLQNGLNAESLYCRLCSTMLYHYLINQEL